ncbi:MAG TPA: hypothetical protein VE974_28850 [Thermoanaerobaculia bacterium]|nr:hypothetical protein [Thermoanaerobaculia bacterium]
MRTNALLLAFLLVAGSAAAQESSPRADYSRDTLMRLFVAASPDEPAVRYRDGGLELRALGATWRAQYLAPLSGSTPGSGWPDPFSLTGTQIATSQRAWRTRREMNRELRRIELTERARVSVTTR